MLKVQKKSKKNGSPAVNNRLQSDCVAYKIICDVEISQEIDFNRNKLSSKNFIVADSLTQIEKKLLHE